MRRFGWIIGIVDLLVLWCSLVAVQGCSDSSATAWAEMPEGISKFMNEYYPDRAMASVVRGADGNYVVTVKDGPVVTFNGQQLWLSVDGRGEVLPQQFLFDCLPPALYSYIQELEEVDKVYMVTRTDKAYDVTLATTSVHYDVGSGEVSLTY